MLFCNPELSLPTACFTGRERQANQGILYKARGNFSIQNSRYQRATGKLQTGFNWGNAIPPYGLRILAEEGKRSSS